MTNKEQPRGEIVYISGKDDDGSYYLEKIRAELGPVRSGDEKPLWFDVNDSYGWEGYAIVHKTEEEARASLCKLAAKDFGYLGRLVNQIYFGEFCLEDCTLD